MATVKIDNFGGIAPRRHPSQLADGMAVISRNCRLKTGKLVPLRQPSKVDGAVIRMENGLGKVSDAKSLFLWSQHGDKEFLAFPGSVHMTDGNIADDEYDRVFVTGETGIGENGCEPCVYLSDNSANSIVRHPIAKDPMPAPRVRLAEGGMQNPDVRRYTYFFQTFVDRFGYESGVSERSVSFDRTCSTADGWTIEFSEDASTVTCSKNGESISTSVKNAVIRYEGETPVSVDVYGNVDFEYNDGDAVIVGALREDEVPDGGGTVAEPTQGMKRRIYKVIAGTGMAVGDIQFIAEFDADPWGQHTIVVKDEDAGEILTEMESAPRDLKNMMFVPGGFYVGFSASHPRTVMFSEVDIPVDWPVAYRYDIKDNIVAIAVTSNSVFVLTDGYPWVLSGTAPGTMVSTHIAGPAACVSERSVCVYKNSVFFASNMGICMIHNDADAGTICTNLTDKIFTKDQWQALNPKSCLMGQHDGALFCFFMLKNGEKKAYTIDLLEDAGVAVNENDEASTCLCADNETDDMYFVRNVESEVE